MKIQKGKIKAATIAVFFALSMIASITLMPFTDAHSPAWQIPTIAYINVAPNPVGLGQQLTVNFWLQMPPPTAENLYGDRWQNMTVNVKLPDGTTSTLGPFTTDPTGGTFTLYTPKELGNYTFQMIFPGQTLAGNNLQPSQTQGLAYIGDYFEPSVSNIVTATVQNEQSSVIPYNPLPTTYWSRPINAENNNWYSIGGNWLGFGGQGSGIMGCYNASTNYNPWSTAPTTSHILWTKPDAFGGTVGGEIGGTETGNFYTNRQYEPPFGPIIMNGILYYTEYPGSWDNPAGWAAVDLQTGQTLWTKDAPLTLPIEVTGHTYSPDTPTEGACTVLRCGQLLDYYTGNQFGVLAYLWSTGTPAEVASVVNVAANSTTYNMFDAMTGTYILSIVNGSSFSSSSASTLTEDNQGDLIGYYVNSSTANVYHAPTLNEWNSTWAIINYGNITGEISSLDNPNNLISWRPPQGAIIPFSDGIEWSVPLPTSYSGNALPSTLAIGAVNSGAIVMDSLSTYSGLSTYQAGWIIEAGYNASTGAQLWITNRTETPFTHINHAGAPNPFVDGCGVYVEVNLNTFTAVGYSDYTGAMLWTKVLPNPNTYDSYEICGEVANGTLYLYGIGGDIYAMNILTGAIYWHTTTTEIQGSSGSNTPYGVWPVWSQLQTEPIADGVIFLSEGHTYTPPLFRGAQEIALNITNGQLIWNILGFDVSSPAAISDGVMVALNDYDNQIYGFGMGPSKTTVTAPDVGVTTAVPITITGSVTDLSAGASQQAVAANFPNGLPCVSDASMTQFMEAVYEQQPMPNNITGVPVTISVIDANGNNRVIGSTTTNANGFFSFNWKPDIPGNFTVTATFAGTQSYYGSSANAAFYASSTATVAPTATPVNGLALNTTLEYGLIGIFIMILIIGAVLAILVTRKRP